MSGTGEGRGVALNDNLSGESSISDVIRTSRPRPGLRARFGQNYAPELKTQLGHLNVPGEV